MYLGFRLQWQKAEIFQNLCWFWGCFLGLVSRPQCHVNALVRHPRSWLNRRLHVSLQLDQSVLESLPPDLREQVECACAAQQAELHSDRKNQPLNGCSTGILPQPIGTVLLQIPEPQESDSDSGINVIALPALSQVR